MTSCDAREAAELMRRWGRNQTMVMRGRAKPSAEDIWRWFAVDTHAGLVVWRVPPRRGKQAGYVLRPRNEPPKRVLQVRYQGRQAMLNYADIVYFAHHGRWPYPFLRHINGDSLDNRIANLREVRARPVRFRARRDPLPMGVRRLERGRYRARIVIRRRERSLGVYDTPADAHRAYLEKRRELYEC